MNCIRETPESQQTEALVVYKGKPIRIPDFLTETLKARRA
jgi:hypothetical protein